MNTIIMITYDDETGEVTIEWPNGKSASIPKPEIMRRLMIEFKRQ